jgi:sulfatase modifying factor 1
LLVYPLLAASLVLSANSDISAQVSLVAEPVSCTYSAESADEGDRRGAKRARVFPFEGDLRSAKEPSRGRSIPLAALKAFEGNDDGDGALEPPAAPTRDNRYVCPSDMVMIGHSYCVDVYEASLMQVMPDGSERVWPYFDVLPEGVVTRAVSQAGVYPQGYISGYQAAAACERSGKRLCKPDEWKNACMGPKKTIFPYGNERQVGRCNDNGRSSMHFFNAELDDKPEHRWMWGYGGNMVDPRLNQLDGTLTRTGERAECTNEYGVFDMVGNLHEWVDDPDGTFQGGYYLDTHLNGDGCYYRTTAHPMSHLDYSTGFRCCADVDDL